MGEERWVGKGIMISRGVRISIAAGGKEMVRAYISGRFFFLFFSLFFFFFFVIMYSLLRCKKLHAA